MDCGGTMEVAALGRPFCLGMFYDCRRDLLVPGMTLWDHDDLKNHIREKPQNYSDFEIVASETIEDKTSALNVEASLKASFLSGLVEVDGSAKYLKDKKASRNLARVTLQYKATTKFQELSMNHLGRGNMKHPYVFDKRIATHVVTAILYGAHAFFVFDREVSEKEDHQDIRGKLKAMIKMIPGLAIEGEATLKMENKEMANVEKFSCRFYGDFSLPKPPSSFQDAIQVYQSLPKLLGLSGENAVPVKVWLLPLTILDSSAAQLVCQIHIRLVQEAQRVLEDMSELDIRCNDAMRTTTAQQFPQICKKLKLFKEKCSEFKLEFQLNLKGKLPAIREGGEEEASLTEILMKRHSSPFNSEHLTEWLDCKEREICVLKSVTNMMKNTKIVPSQNGLHEETLSAEHAVCFVFTSLGNAEPYLLALSNYVKITTKPDDPQDPQAYDVEKEQWYLSSEVSDTMRKQAKLFSDFAESNKENKNIKFLSMGLTNETLKGSSIYLYKDGSCVNDSFQPPSKPETVTVSNISLNTVTLHISPPKCGAEDVTSYSVEYCVRGEDGWQQKMVLKAEEVKVSDLSPNTEYVFRCRAVTSVGVGPVHEVSGTIKTLPCSPPGKPQVESNSSEISVSWQRPAEVGRDVQQLSYIIEYAQTDNGVKSEDLQWSQTMSRAERAIISGLKSETEYVVRVRCDYGVAGRSKESIAVNVHTTKLSLLTESLKRTSERINSESPYIYKLPLTEVDVNIGECRRFNFGKEGLRRNRSIILLEVPGSETSTLINGMINYIVGVEWKDNFRFKLIDEAQLSCQVKGQTSEVVEYKINHQDGFKIDYSLTIVDIAVEGRPQKYLYNLSTAEQGVKEINAVCIVAPAALTQLTQRQKYFLKRFLSCIKNNVAENVRVLVTFADGRRPPVLEAISAAGVPCPKAEDGLPLHFKFNNSALFANNKSSAAASTSEDDENANYDQMFWNVGTKSMKMFFDTVNEMESLIISEAHSIIHLSELLRDIGHKLDQDL
ncbi:verrucotoxin subunit beta-like isoform X2 [Paralichthys olivaceus]|uniref:verrucotoxin subunit beta-like isoform X2 n=1 Tax=Paralichthys olivaceus TaxID=8255 RepID=UPI003751BF0B